MRVFRQFPREVRIMILPRTSVNRARACLAAPNPKTRGPKLVR